MAAGSGEGLGVRARISLAPKQPRRLAAIPDPYPDESFGSWLARLSASHHTDRASFVRALLTECGATPFPIGDYEAAPPRELMEALEQRTGWPMERLRALLVPRGEAMFPTRLADERFAHYCPACYAKDAKSGRRYIRRAWCERWGIVCEVHQLLLRETACPIEALLAGSQRAEPRWIQAGPAGTFPASLCESMTHTQRLLRALGKGDALPAPSQERARVLQDLTILAGTRFDGGSLIEWSLAAPGSHQSKLYWCDESGCALSDVPEPRGSLVVRRHALRLATLIMQQMEGARAFTRKQDIALWALLRWVEPQVDLAWAINDKRRGWSAHYQGLWHCAFAWPDRRDPVVWAQERAWDGALRF
jgi:hypothetical protein